MENKNEKKKWIVGFGLFMVLMFIMTFVSRIIYVNNMPQVRWSHPSAASIQNTLTAEGTVETVNSQAITGMDGLLVREVYVAMGEQIEEGSLLYEVNTEDLQRQLSILQAEEKVWQNQVRVERNMAATEITRALEDYDITVAELDRRIVELRDQLEDVKEDLDLHLYRVPEEEAPDEVWIAWVDERTRLERALEDKKREVEEAGYEKEAILTQAGRVIEDAQKDQNMVEGSYSSSFNAIAQVQQRQQKIAAWTKLLEEEGKVRAQQAGTVLEVMLQSGVRMGEGAVMRYSDAESSLVFKTVITQEQKPMVHTGDRVRISFPGSSEEVSETIDSVVQENGGYTVTVWLEPGVARGRTEGIMNVSVTSQVYDFVIPRQALHNDGETNFIYILEEKAGILGNEIIVRRLVVRLLDQNEDRAAIAEDILQSNMMIVTDSDKALENGSAVKEWDTVPAQ